MKEVEIKNLWNEAFNNLPGHPKIQIEMIKNRIQEFDEKIRRRDKIEILAAVFVIIFFGSITIFMENTVSRLGAAIIVLGAVIIIVVLQKISKIKKTSLSDISTRQYIMNSIHQIRKQKTLLKNIAFWYILPLYSGLIIFQWSRSTSLTYFLFFMALFTMGSIAIYIYNKKAIKKDLEPLEAQLENFLKEIDNPL